jgi:hypothetical protein
MRVIFAGLIWIALLALPDLASAKPDGVPRFDVARSCEDALAYTGDDKNLGYRGCMKDENDARAQLVQKWAHFKPGDRKDCVAQGAAPVPSYVEILTCLEMSEEADALYKPDGSHRDKPLGGAVQGKSGQDQATPSSAAPASPPESAAAQGKSGQDQATPSSATPPPPESGGAKKPD